MPARKYSDEIIGQAAELRERGLSFGQIALRLGMSASAVDWHCLKLGADSPKTATQIIVRRQPMVMRRGSHVVRLFSEDEDRQLIALSLAEATIADMSRALNRRHNSIKGRLMTLARIEARKEARDAAWAAQ